MGSRWQLNTFLHLFGGERGRHLVSQVVKELLAILGGKVL